MSGRLRALTGLMLVGLILTIGLGGCGGSQGAIASRAAPHVESSGAPAWSAQGDRTSTAGFRFICQGEGANPDEAATAARAFCEDKVCKLCGVEVESVVRSKETLSGVQMSREVVERCRRVRTKPVKVIRQSVDCPQEGRCSAWIEVDYSRAQRDRDCQQYADQNFDDPEACQRQLDTFSQIYGYSAASVRKRIATLEAALVACKNIDVRPTPLLNALDERLRRGMTRFTDAEGRAPRYLSKYWLASHAPTWQAYERSTTFLGKIELLLSYLRSKPPQLDVLEAAQRPSSELDSEAGFKMLLKRLEQAPVDGGYGASRVHFFALDRIRQLHRKRMFHQPLSPLWALLVTKYSPSTLKRWNEIVDLTWLASVDQKVSNEEWRYLLETPRW
ncbi:MAG: hypothetical protein AAF449_15390, partial [Myxococcota bacterium]